MLQLSLDTLDYVVLAGYLLSFAGLAFFARARTLRTYWANDRSTGPRALTLSLVSTIMGAGSIFAATSMTYTGGLVVFSAGLGYALGLFLLGLWAPKIQKIAQEKNIYSFPDFLETLFSRRCRFIGALIQFFVYFFYLAGQLIALSVICHLVTGLSPYLSLGIAILLILSYTLLGGIKMDIIADNIQFYVSLFVFILLPVLIFRTEGLFEKITQLPMSFLLGDAMGGAPFMISLTLVIFLGVLVSADSWMRIYSARTPQIAKQSLLASSLLVFLFVSVVGLVGLAAKATFPSIEADGAFLTMVATYVPTGLLGFVIAGLLAAILSSADSMLLITGMVVAEDAVNLFAPQIKKDDRKILFLVRAINTGLLLAAVGLALLLPNLVEIMVNAASVLMILVPSVLVGLFVKKKDEPAVFWSLFCGFVMTIAGFFLMPAMPYIPGGASCLVVFFLVRFRPRKKAFV